MILIPTGVASVNIDGRIMHSALRFPTNLHTCSSLCDSFNRSFQFSMEILYFLIIEEFSMIVCNMMNPIEKRWKEVKPVFQEWFSGSFVSLIGDIWQRQTVQEKPFFSELEQLNERVRHAFTTINSCGICFKCLR